MLAASLSDPGVSCQAIDALEKKMEKENVHTEKNVHECSLQYCL